jgi:tyrosyl-tRNA synthetase
MRLANEVVKIFHSQSAADRAAKHFSKVFQKHHQPDDMAEYKISPGETVVDVLVNTKFAGSRSEAKKLIAGGGVKLGDKLVDDQQMIVEMKNLPVVLQKGKRFFVKLVS